MRGGTSVASAANCTRPSGTCANTWGHTLMKGRITAAGATKGTRPRWCCCGKVKNARLSSSPAKRSFFHPQNALQVHQRTHGEEKPYVCQYCMKGFREKGSLVRHVRHHTGEKPFKCPKCGRAFAEHGTLNRHMRAKGQCGEGICNSDQDRFWAVSFVATMMLFRHGLPNLTLPAVISGRWLP